MSFLNSFYIPSINIKDIFEIFIIVFLIYYVIKSFKNTRAVLFLKGIFVLLIIYVFALILEFKAIIILFNSLLLFLAIALIVILQPEMRKFLETIGTKRITTNLSIFSLFTKNKEEKKFYSDKSISELVKASYSMGKVKTGALIVIERNIPLTEYIKTGIVLNADISSQLLINIFEKNTPLHDGAVIQVNDKLVSGTCYLPLSDNKNISKHMGTRHRAAIGVTENSDCIVIVVSEETGSVSIAYNGNIEYDLTKEDFTSLLYKYQKKDIVLEDKDEKGNIKETIKSEKFKNIFTSFFVGIISWVLLMNLSNPIVTKVIEDVPINFINTSIIESTGRTYEVLSEDTVDVVIKDNRSIVDTITKEDIYVVADFSKLSYVNAIPLEGTIKNNVSTEVSFKSEDIITVELDSLVSKEIDVEVHSYAQNYSNTFVPILKADLESIIVTGGQSKIETIDKAVCTFDVTNIVGVYESSSNFELYDKNGNVMNKEHFKFSNDEISVRGLSYNIKEIPISFSLNSRIVGRYKVSDIVYEPKSLRIAGEDSLLEKIESLNINVNLNMESENILNNQFIKNVNIKDSLPEGLYLVAEEYENIPVTFIFENLKTKEVSFSKESIEISGKDDNIDAIIEDETFNVVINGEEEYISSLNIETLKPFIDVTNLKEGNYNLILQFKGLENVILENNISVKVKIISK